jgi:hypothetical protein
MNYVLKNLFRLDLDNSGGINYLEFVWNQSIFLVKFYF